MRRFLLFISILLLVMGGCMSLVPPEPERNPDPVARTETPEGFERPLMIAHRCGSARGPENTCGAVVQSSFFRPDFYEIDIRHTADGIPICVHDEILSRTTNAVDISEELGLPSLNVSEWTLSDINQLDAGSWFGPTFEHEPIPTLERMLDCANPSPLAIELKEPEITHEQCDEIARMLRERDDISSVILSFHRSALDTYREADPDRRTCWLTTSIDDYALEGPHEIVGLLASRCTGEVVEEIHEAGKAVWVWTVNEDYEDYIEMGVDGITTDHPDWLRDILPPS
jgi:glycerophosphoryl diester phosphodiesterase